MDAVVNVLVRLAGNEPVGLHLAIGDQRQPFLVVRARVTRAHTRREGEPELRPVTAHLSWQERERASSIPLAMSILAPKREIGMLERSAFPAAR
jgi:hypothetical protein